MTLQRENRRLGVITAVLANWPGRKVEVTLKEITEITGIVAPVLYNYFKGIEDINTQMKEFMISELRGVLSFNPMFNIPPEMKAKILIHNLLNFFEEKRYPSFFLTDPEGESSFMGILRKRFEEILGPGNTFRIYRILHLISAYVDSYRETGGNIPEGAADEIFSIS